MKLSQFWNKAIEYYCTFNSPDRLNRFDTVFISISEESLERVYEKYMREGNLITQDIEPLTFNIERVGGILNSYYSAVKDIHNDFNSPAQYSFLRFSILVIGAFKQDYSPLRNYWKEFDSFLQIKNIQVLNPNQRTSYLKNVIENISKNCAIIHQKTFFQANVFGDNHDLVNVGRIKAHSIFQGRSLVAIKKALYSLNYADTHNVEDLIIEDVEKMLKSSGLTRILKLFQRDNDTKEIILICLQIWLKNWVPNQAEKIQLLKGSRTSEEKPRLQIKRIWEINSGNKIEIKFGFFLKSSLGDDNIFYLNRDKNIFVDVAWGIKQNENRILYLIENYSDKHDLNSNDLGYQFETCTLDNNRLDYVLEKIPHLTKLIFLEQSVNRIKIQDNPVILASKNKVERGNIDFFYQFPLENQPDLIFNWYRLKEEYFYKDFSFIKTNNLNISPVGITDGRPGIKSFLSAFPIKIKYNNISKGEIHIFHNNQIFKKISLSNASNNLDCEEDIGYLDSGSYSIKYLNDKKQYDNFINGYEFIDFEIVDSGHRDSRIELPIVTVPTFDYHEFRISKEIKKFEDSFLILHDNNSELKFEDKHTYFYFDKNNNDEWIIKPNKKCFFIQRLKSKPSNFSEVYYKYHQELEYLSTRFKKYKFKISFCEKPETIILSFNLSDFYQRNEECKIISDYIKINCYYFKLEGLDDELKEKYPSVEVGDVLYIISNKSEPKPENLLKLLTQEVFPFKKV
jgi:hypothetical protein